MSKPLPIPSDRTRRRWTEKEARAALAALAASRLTSSPRVRDRRPAAVQLAPKASSVTSRATLAPPADKRRCLRRVIGAPRARARVNLRR